MYISSLLTPKSNTVFVYASDTIDCALNKLRQSGFKEIPVIMKNGQYIGLVSEGDFLWKMKLADAKQDARVSTICRKENTPIKITETVDSIIKRILDQNFLPVVDDRGCFCGIITRKSIIQHLLKTLAQQTYIHEDFSEW